MTAASLLTLLPAFALGWGLTAWLWPRPAQAAELLFQLIVGAGLGVGVRTCLAFFCLLLSGARFGGLLWVELLLAAGLWGLALRARRAAPRPAGAFWPRPSAWGWGLLGVLAVCTAAAAFSYLETVQHTPHGTFDAYAIWNLRARHLLSAADWRTAFSPALNWKAHADYPLLIPLSAAVSWDWLGQPTVRTPMLLAGLWTWGTLGLLFSALWGRRGMAAASLGALVVVSSPLLIWVGSNQTADMAVAFFVLAAMALAWLASTRGWPAGMLALAGLCAAMAAWAKNEGIVFGLGTLAAGAAVSLRTRHPRWLGWLAAGAALPVLALFLFKGWVAPPGDLFAQGMGDILARLADPARYGVVWRGLVETLPQVGAWHVLLVYTALTAKRLHGAEALAGWAGLAVWGAAAAAALMIYVITPHPQAWHLKYSLDRVLFQLFPAAVLWMGLAARPPEDWKLFSKG